MKSILNSISDTKTAKQINQVLKGKTVAQKIEIISRWIDDKRDKLSPASFIDEQMYLNYLHYLLVNGADEKIGNGKPFIPEQNYQQEYDQEFDRLFMLGGLDELFKKDELFREFCYTIDCAIQDRFFRRLSDTNSKSVNKLPKITTLW